MTGLTKDEVSHAPSPTGDGRTFCGLALEGAPSDFQPPSIVRSGWVVTCDDCKRMIAHAQDRFTPNYRYKA